MGERETKGSEAYPIGLSTYKDMADLTRDVAEEVFTRVPITFLRKIRFTCKRWNNLCKSFSFAKKHLGKSKEFVMVVVMMEFRVYLMRVNLDKDVESCIEREAGLISLDDLHQIDVYQVFHCHGLLLCISQDNKTLVVWNPYWGQTRWIVPTHNFYRLDRYRYALGYDRSSKFFKVLRFIEFGEIDAFAEFKIYDLNSDSWRVLGVTRDWKIYHYDRGVSLKGDTYWIAEEMPGAEEDGKFLVCFDFTRERFGARLPLPTLEWDPEDTLTLSSVKEEQLAVLFQRSDTLVMEIWVTTMIDPNAVSWSSKLFLAADIRQLIGPEVLFPWAAGCFFIDQEKEVAVVFDKEKDSLMNPTRNVAYIFGVDGSLKEADLGKSLYRLCYPLVCSYVPSLVQL